MISLTENEVKKVALGFLRFYYGRRPREESYPSISKTDLQTDNGIVVDGYFSYKQPDGKIFTATLEATSADKHQELYYEPRRELLFWDSLTASLALITLGSAVLHSYAYYPLAEFGWWYFPMLLAAIAVMAIVIWVAIQVFPRYRYIYAIDQFRAYAANEQWVAYAEDVFPPRQSGLLKELRRQCVRYGFGLIEVNGSFQAKMLVAPARGDNVFVGRRATVALLPTEQISRSFDRLRQQQFFRATRNQLSSRLRWLGGRKRRRLAPFFNQYLITGIASCLLFFLVYQQFDHVPIRYETAWYHDRSRERMADTLRPETLQVDPAPIYLPVGDTLFKAYTPAPDREFFDDLLEPRLAAVPRALPDTAAAVDVRMVIKEPTAQPIFYYDCSRLELYDTTIYLLQDTFLTTLDAARRRVDDFNRFGLTGSVIWGPCLGQPATGYAVCAEYVFVDSLQAAERAGVLREELDTLGLRLQLQTYR